MVGIVKVRALTFGRDTPSTDQNRTTIISNCPLPNRSATHRDGNKLIARIILAAALWEVFELLDESGMHCTVGRVENC